jgi:hypothetical protein
MFFAFNVLGKLIEINAEEIRRMEDLGINVFQTYELFYIGF